MPKIQDGGQNSGQHLKFLKSVHDVMLGVYSYVFLVVDSKLEVQNVFRLKGTP